MKYLLWMLGFFTSGNSYANTMDGIDTVHYPEEKHFTNVKQLTFGGDNAEAYWSYDGKWIVFQRTAPKDGTGV
jgi:hypothetical protein